MQDNAELSHARNQLVNTDTKSRSLHAQVRESCRKSAIVSIATFTHIIRVNLYSPAIAIAWRERVLLP